MATRKQIEADDKKSSNGGNRTPEGIVDELRRLHDELGDQISELEEDPETTTSALQCIYAEMEIQLDALEDALGAE